MTHLTTLDELKPHITLLVSVEESDALFVSVHLNLEDGEAGRAAERAGRNVTKHVDWLRENARPAMPQRLPFCRAMPLICPRTEEI